VNEDADTPSQSRNQDGANAARCDEDERKNGGITREMGEETNATVRSASCTADDLAMFDLGRIEFMVGISFAATTAPAMFVMMFPTTLAASGTPTSTRFLAFGSSFVSMRLWVRRPAMAFEILDMSGPFL
jgi:hypothetical protein